MNLRERNRQVAMDDLRSVAFDLMSARGFDAVRVDEIAAESNVSPSTIYRYFGTKQALVLSASRPTQLVERLRRDDSRRSWSESFRRAAVKAWADGEVEVELGLVLANDGLRAAWERQLLDQRADIAAALAARRGKSGGAKDDARAAAAVGVLIATLVRWHGAGGGKKELARLLGRAFDAVRSD